MEVTRGSKQANKDGRLMLFRLLLDVANLLRQLLQIVLVGGVLKLEFCDGRSTSLDRLSTITAQNMVVLSYLVVSWSRLVAPWFV